MAKNSAARASENDSAESEIHWLEADKGYSVALLGESLVCRNQKGKQLKSVPKWLKDSELGGELLALRDFLKEHSENCRAEAEKWLLRSLPVPKTVLENVWPDPAWSELLRNTVVCAVGKDAQLDQDKSGFLREISAKGVGVVDLDGETQWLKTTSIAIPHPILLEELDDCRELAAELGFHQSLDQLFRQTFGRPKDLDEKAGSLDDWTNGKFAELRHATALTRRLGYRVSGGYAVCRVWEEGQPFEARYWIGSENPDYETFTGGLSFVDRDERGIALSDVGPVTYSEGVRMATSIYAKRVVESEEE